ncbi:M14 family metallopeptidase [Flavobacterium sp.]|uniref:M14 family metallopeptidase n=1 Tax=Flavobacterium sp. TaxID=239 RepID=UPI00262DBAAF|nr:M14 family metallopeptidase [Flavobacterium sp.]
MRFYTSVLLLFSIVISAQTNTKYTTFFEKGNGNQTATYQEVISFYKMLDKDFPSVKVEQMGLTDSGKPLHMVTFNPDNTFDFKSIQKNKAVILINNGIHAGEPDGIDATMMLFRDLATAKVKIPKNTVIVTIPVYNIGGALNRNSHSRVNQNGPEEYGFRGNGRNFDLNRDFIKSDTKNTESFIEIFQKVNPEVFIDNHVSNGADYQYSLTYIQTQHNKLGAALGDYMNEKMTPAIVADLKSKKIESTPYVNVWDGTPEKGFPQFVDAPRYATGYTSIFNTMGYVIETHMLKDYAKRVHATYEFMVSAIKYVDENVKIIKTIKEKNANQYQPKMNYPIQWELDSTKVNKMNFLGYEGGYKKSDVTSGTRLFYDETKPYNKEINFYSGYKPVKEVVVPNAYIIPKSWWRVIDLLKNSHCAYSTLKKDTIIEVESYKIADYKTGTNAYEGHYLHRNTSVSKSIQKVAFAKGDYIFPTSENGLKYLLETLEPEAMDSFFNWNFFDTILQQKEGYSDYVFEDLAAKFLLENPEVKARFEEKMKTDKAFAENPAGQLDWVYKNSPYYEKAHLQYPVCRIIK